MKPIERVVEQALAPFDQFVRNQATGSVALLLCTVLALLWVNSPWVEHYRALFRPTLGLTAGEWELSMSVRDWISHGLMSGFFYLIGLEIKREFIAGELRDLRRSVPVIMAAVGGMVFPAGVYVALTYQDPSIAAGWGIPMATDAAFAIGLLTLLGSRIPASLLAFVTALAIIDDLGAIIVIAVFYSENIHLASLASVGALLAVLVLCNVVGLHRPLLYLCVGIVIWYFAHHSGVHATVAGILVALTVPARPKRGTAWFVKRLHKLARRYESRAERGEAPLLVDQDRHELAEHVAASVREATTPLQRWQHRFEPAVLLLIMPLFALANAGVVVDADALRALWQSPLSLGVAGGLVLGKVSGICLMTWLALRLGAGELPSGCTFAHIVGVGLLAGVGFTMSIFVAGLSFDVESPAYQVARSAILFSSLVAGAAGVAWLWLADRLRPTAVA